MIYYINNRLHSDICQAKLYYIKLIAKFKKVLIITRV